MEALYSVITEYVIDAAELDIDELAPDEDLIELGLDSLAGLEIAVNIEKKYQIKIPPARYEEMTTVRKIAEILSELLEEKQAVPAE
ncbi:MULTISPECIES: acyl carrier protein [unclassified Photobacterium]|uniref:acyl carrier protein n=1 Tax=unclassified Photobacterium TaxID=2628852 RepID=UPI001B8D5250|nr:MULTISPECIES: acyl carrier protein [unclassified Photobacterium]MDO6708154.1 acyl carrier protein [Photobacterium sp. 1_MG-2023]QUJ70207.1 acyl carrier protein [Photobacterium sp. GJ3]